MLPEKINGCRFGRLTKILHAVTHLYCFGTVHACFFGFIRFLKSDTGSGIYSSGLPTGSYSGELLCLEYDG